MYRRQRPREATIERVAVTRHLETFAALLAVALIASMLIAVGRPAHAAVTPPVLPDDIVPVRAIVNPSFETAGRSSAYYFWAEAENGIVDTGQILMPGWQTTAPAVPRYNLERPVEVWDSGYTATNGVTYLAHSGSQLVELNAFEPAALFQDVCLASGETVDWSFFHQFRSGNGNGTRQEVELTMSDPNLWVDTLPPYSLDYRSPILGVDTAGDWVEQSGSFTVGATGVYRLAISAVLTEGVEGDEGNLLDDVSLGDLPPHVEFYETDQAAGINVTTDTEDENYYLSLAVNGHVPASGSTVIITPGGDVDADDYTIGGVFDGAGDLSEATAVEGADGVITVTIPEGSYDGRQGSGVTIALDLSDDLVEATETATFTLSEGTGALEIADVSGCVDAGRTVVSLTLEDNDNEARDDYTTMKPSGAQPFDVAYNDPTIRPGSTFTLTGEGNYAGTVSIDPETGVVTYTPAEGESATTVTIEYEVCDASGTGCDTAVLAIAIQAIPVADDDTATTDPGVAVNVDVLDGDVDRDGDLVGSSITLIDPATGLADTDGFVEVPGVGSWTVDQSYGQVEFMPAAGFAGDAVISYTVADDDGNVSNEAVITVTVTSLEAADDSATMAPAGTQTVDVSDNDPKAPQDSDFYLTGVGTAQGPVEIDPDTGVITYTPHASEPGSTVTVEYEVCPDGVTSGAASCDTAVLSIAIAALEASDDAAEMSPFGAQTFDVTANDAAAPDGVDYSLTGVGTARGEATIDPDSGVVTYRPAAGEAGTTVTVEYQVCPDSAGSGSPGCATAVLAIEIGIPPVADDDADATYPLVPVSIDVLDGDIDVDGSLDPATITLIDPATGAADDDGLVEVAGVGSWTVIPSTPLVNFVPADGFLGEAVISYTVSDDDGLVSNVADITVTVGPIEVVDDSVLITPGSPQTFDPSANDPRVPDGADFSLTGEGTAQGDVSIDAQTGVITYEPLVSEAGTTVTLEYEVCPDGVDGGSQACEQATVAIEVNGRRVVGTVHFDADRDGVVDASEDGVAGVTVRLIGPGSDQVFGNDDDVVVAETVTTADGYEFLGVHDGKYRVEVVTSTLPEGIYVTDDSDGGADNSVMVMVNGGDAAEATFGYFYPGVYGVFTDDDGSPVPNATVTVTDSDGRTWTTTTDDSGRYSVDGSANQPMSAGEVTVTGTTADGDTVKVSVTVDGADPRRVDLVATSATSESGGSTVSSGNSSSDTGATATSTLPLTGSSLTRLLLGSAGLLMVAGFVLVVASRWRRSRVF